MATHSWQPVPRPGFTVEGGPLPAVRDVAVSFDGNPGTPVWLTQRGGDEHVWELDVVGSYDAAKHPVTGFARLAVAPNRTLWAVGSNGTLWRRAPSGHWLQTNTEGIISAPLDDVTVALDGTVWLTGTDGTLWTTTDGSALVDRTVLFPFRRLAAAPGGVLWGITFHPALTRFNGSWWEVIASGDYLDLSVSFDGLLWLVRRDGVIATTPDGRNLTALPGQSGFENVCAGRYGISWGAKSDGSLFIWQPIPPGETPPPPPPPPPPSPPTISVSVEGGGANSVYVVSGSQFKPSSSVSIRVTRIEKGVIHDVRFNTSSNSAGHISARLAIPCASGLEFNFSATDGRPNPGDLTGFLWSIPIPPVVCP